MEQNDFIKTYIKKIIKSEIIKIKKKISSDTESKRIKGQFTNFEIISLKKR